MKLWRAALSLALIASVRGIARGAEEAVPASADAAPVSANAAPASADSAPTANAENSSVALGPVFEDDAAGISLRVPVGCVRLRASGEGDDIARFGDQARKWQIKLTRVVEPQPRTLSGSVDNFGKPVPGLLDQTVAGLRHDLSGCTILRQDLTNIADGELRASAEDRASERDNVGMIAVHFTAGGTHFLSQQAIIQADARLFYFMTLTGPAGDPNAPAAPAERAQVETFRQMLDSVRLLNTADIRKDQVQRLIRTRYLLESLKSKTRLRAALIDEQWLRIIRDGRDIGYTYITEQTAAGIPRPLTPQEIHAGKGDRDLVRPGDGILIGIRARSITPPETNDSAAHGPVQADSATWLFFTPDQKLEDWSRITVFRDGTRDKSGKPIERPYTELGNSSVEVRTELDKQAMPGTAIDPRQPPVSIVERRQLNVTTITDTGASEPFNQDVPVFYLSQGLGHLLPRLLPLRPRADREPRSYMFATWVPETHQVMSRYVDVGDEGDFDFAGRKIRAIPISDRIGWHGAVTTHYFSPDGRYLGSENREARTLILPSDAASLLAIWKDADLSRPGAVVRPHAVSTLLPDRPEAAGPPAPAH